MAFSLADIATRTGLVLAGRGELLVTGAAEPHRAGPDQLAMALSPAYGAAIGAGSAKAAVLWDGADWQALGLEGALFAPRARLAIAAVSEVFAHPPDIEAGIHPSAVVAPDAEIGPGAFIGPLAVIGAGVTLGANARIAAHASIGAQARIGADALIHSGARIGARVTIGARAIIHPNAVIGADGFSFVTPEPGSVEAAKQGSAVTEQRNTELRRIHSLAAVTLGDDVEIGAGATIDRGTIADTQIGSGTKIDNLVQIGHNVRVGALCMICALSGVAGSTRIGDRVVLGGRTGIADHVKIGDDVVVAATSGISGDVAAGSVMMGTPALPKRDFIEQLMALKRLPRIVKTVRGIEKKLGL